jgi:hypothetical protein
MKNKKGVSQIWWVLSSAIIAMLAVIFIIVWFTSSGGKLQEGFEDTIGDLDDKDKDGITDLLDKCPCDHNIGRDFEEGKPRVCAIECVKEVANE